MRKILHSIFILALFVNSGYGQVSDSLRYDSLLSNYRHGHKAYSEMPWLVQGARYYKNFILADSIAYDYSDNFLASLKDDAFFTKLNLDFIGYYEKRPHSISFQRIYRQQAKANEKTDPLFSKRYIEFVITSSNIRPFIYQHKAYVDHPDWNNIIKKMNGAFTKEEIKHAVLDSRINWAEAKKDSTLFTELSLQKIDEEGADTVGPLAKFSLNNFLWNYIFLRPVDERTLNKGIKVAKLLIGTNSTADSNPSMLDTYANLLYKAGRKKEAISWEEKAAQIDFENGAKENRKPDPLFQQTLDKMRANLK